MRPDRCALGALLLTAMAASIAAAGIPGPGTPVSQADSFTNACEVAMEAPLVGALMFERTEKGALVCYDLGRK